jgi:transmembrane sensor
MDFRARLQFLFSKYLNRSSTPEEVAELVALLQQPEADEAISGPMESLWIELRENKAQCGVNWDKMYGILSQTEADLVYLNQRRNTGARKTFIRVAAVAILCFLVCGIYWQFSKSKEKRKEAMVTQSKDIGTPPPLQKQIIHLADGSTVILNADSKLDYPIEFKGKTREVFLSGEGFFDIIHLSSRPFLVHTGKITTRVLGTAFNIRAYPGDEAIEVTVTRGKVQVEKENRKMGFLTANQQLSFSFKTEEFVRKQVDIKSIIAWKPKEISFDDITMGEAARRIGDRFKMAVEFLNPAIRDCRVTATFYEVDRLNEIMTVICGVSRSSFTIQNKTIIIDGKGCN